MSDTNQGTLQELSKNLEAIVKIVREGGTPEERHEARTLIQESLFRATSGEGL